MADDLVRGGCSASSSVAATSFGSVQNREAPGCGSQAEPRAGVEEVAVGMLVGVSGSAWGTSRSVPGGVRRSARPGAGCGGGSDPARAGDGDGDRDKMQALVGEVLAGFPGEEAVDPQPGPVVLTEVVPHPVDLEAVGQTGMASSPERGAGPRFVRRDALVGVEREDPVGLSPPRPRAAVAVRRVVPAAIVEPWRVVQDELDEGFASRIRRVPSVLPSSRAITASAKEPPTPDTPADRPRRCARAVGRRV